MRVLIRCEKCNTLYELDEKVLPPNGAPVQCSKCQFVFTARPGARAEPAPASTDAVAKGEETISPGTSGPAPSQVGEGGEPLPSVPEPIAIPPPAANPSASAGRRVSSGPLQEPSDAKAPQAQAAKRTNLPGGSAPDPGEPQFTADGRPIRKVPFPTEEPAAAGVRPVLGKVTGRSGASSPQRRWALVVVPVALALVLAAAFMAWRMLGRRSSPAAVQQRPEGHSLLFRGEHASPCSRPVEKWTARPLGGAGAAFAPGYTGRLVRDARYALE